MAKIRKGKGKAVPSIAKGVKVSWVSGKKWGLTIGETWHKIFSDNEKAPKAKKLTDEQIHKWMSVEFPGRKSMDFKDVAGVQRARSYYNRGKFDPESWDIPPKMLSRPYDKDGNPIKVKRGPEKAAVARKRADKPRKRDRKKERTRPSTRKTAKKPKPKPKPKRDKKETEDSKPKPETEQTPEAA